MKTLPFPLTTCLSMVCLVLASGCANWNTADNHQARAFEFPKSRMSPDSVAIEIGVAELQSDQAELLGEFFQKLDQQELPLKTRQQLDRNGLQCGIMSTRAPAVFHQLLEPYQPDPDSLEPAAKQLALAGRLEPVSRLLVHKRISNHDGEVYPVGTSDEYSQLTWRLHHSKHADSVERAERLNSGSAKLARGFVDITTFPNTDGSATLKLVPAIQHGVERPRIGIAAGTFVMDRGQQRRRLDDLGFEVRLRVGETLILTATQPFDSDDRTTETSVGQVITGSARSDATRLLLVRLVQTQMDDLFDRSLSTERLSARSDL